MFSKKVLMAFDTLQVKVVEGLLHVNFTNTIGHRSTGASSRWRGRESWGDTTLSWGETTWGETTCFLHEKAFGQNKL